MEKERGTCEKCEGKTLGYICDECGEEFDRQEKHHKHYGDHVQRMCVRCAGPEMECRCD